MSVSAGLPASFHMLKSALILPLPDRLSWGCAVPPGSTLTTVSNLALPLDAIDGNTTVIEKYAIRDRELAYRDLVVASQLVKVAFRLATTWNFSPNYPKMPGPVVDRIYADPADLASPAALGQVDYVASADSPDAALTTDKHLYERDLLLLQGLSEVAAPILKHNSPIWTSRVDSYVANVVTTAQDHGYSTGFGIRLSAEHALPTGPTPSGSDPKLSIVYYVRVLSATTFTLHPSRAMAFANANAVSVSGNVSSDNHYAIFSGFGLSISSSWSPASGKTDNREVNPALPLDVDLFKRPDTNLAYRDNQVAAHAAQMVQLLESPFEYADRLLVEVTHSEDPEDPHNREPEVYALLHETSTYRTWAVEPHLNGRCVLVYHRYSKHLQWTTEDQLQLHIPQPAGFTFDGVVAGQELRVLPELPAPTTANFWRQKAGRLTFPGAAERVVSYLRQPSTAFVGAADRNAVKLATGDVVLCTAGVSTFNCTGTAAIAWSAGTYRTGDVVAHNDTFYTALKTTTVEAGTDATHWKPIPDPENLRVAVSVTPLSYLDLLGTEQTSNLPLEAGGGVEFDDSHLTAQWRIKLPTGNWELEVFYSSKASGPSPSAFPIKLTFGSHIISVTPLKYGVTTGTVLSERFVILTDPSGGPQTLSIEWTSGAGAVESLLVHKIRFRSTLKTPISYQLTCAVAGTDLGSVHVVGTRDEPMVVNFAGTSFDDLVDPALQLTYVSTSDAPLSIHSAAICLTYPVVGAQLTPAAAGFERWRLEHRLRYLATLRDLYCRFMELYVVSTGQVVEGQEYTVSGGLVRYDGTVYGGTGNTHFVGTEVTYYDVVDGTPTVVRSDGPIPDLVGDTRIWTADSTAAWLDYLSLFDPSIGLTLRDPTPLDVGLPALVPDGLELTAGGVVNNLSTAASLPTIQAFQPWMERLGLKCLHHSFSNPSDRLGWVGEFGR